MNSLQKRLLLLGGGFLVLLILLFIILRSLQGPKEPQIANVGLSPTPIEVGGPRFLSTQEKRKIATDMNKNYFDFTASEEARLRRLCDYRSPDFDISCSPMLNQYFVSRKNGQSEERFRSLLEERALLNLYENNSSLFIITDLDVNTALNQAEENFLGIIDKEEQQEPENQPGQAGNGKKDENLQLLVDLMQTLLSFDLGTATPSGSSGSGDGGSGDNTEPVSGLSYPPNLGNPNSMNYYQMPVGVGTWVFSSPSCRGHHWGHRNMIGVLYTVANRWRESHPNSRLRIGDITADDTFVAHQTHHNGIDVDITTTDRSAADINGTIEANVEYGKMFIDTGAVERIIFGSTASSKVNAVNNQLKAYANSKKIPVRVYPYSGHDGHFHVSVFPKYSLSFWKPGC